ncbi:hypothetical protein [Halopelagius longus]|nr:hypothetical protein [Halopelagius longus]
MGRRPYLKLAGAAVGAIALGSSSASAADTSVVVVDGRGGTDKTHYVIEVSDSIKKINTSVADTLSDSVSDTKVEGSVADGVDAFEYTGHITEFDFDGSAKVTTKPTLKDVSSDLVPEETSKNKIEVVSDGSITYEFTTSGKITKLFDNGKKSAEKENDSVTENDDGTWSASGFTGNGYGDGFEFEGELKAFSPNSDDFRLLLNGKEVSPEDFGDVSNDSGSDSDSSSSSSGSNEAHIGGGEGYSNVVPESEATEVVSSLSDLKSALNGASSGDVVYVAGDAEINMRESKLTVPSGVTLASNRGIGGAKGARLYTKGHPWGMLTLQSNSRVTGLRIAGPRWDWVDETETTELGLDAAGSGVEVDNIEGYGWGYAVVRTADDTHVHHCHLHHCSRMGHGYGIATEGSDYPIIEYNKFEHNRHSVQGNGGGYEIRYNVVDVPAISHVFDQHRPGGKTMKIHHNTVRVVKDEGGRSGSGNAPAVAIRGVPDDVADIHDNWFFNDKKPRSSPSGWTDEAIIQVHTDSWQNVEFNNNHYGSDEPASDIGHPR